VKNLANMPSDKSDIVFCCMPWVVTRRPSLALGILKGICTQENVAAKVIYPNFDMAAKIGMKLSGALASKRELFGLSEHLFSCDIYSPEELNSDQFLQAHASRENVMSSIPPQFWFDARDHLIPVFLEEVLERILDMNPSIVAFSATFNQVMGSVAMAKRVKEANPNIITICGGASFHEPMGLEYHRVFSKYIDHISLGEADDSFRTFITNWRDGKPLEKISGITYLQDGEIAFAPSEVVRDLDRLPTPDYDDYFEEGERLVDNPRFKLVVESLGYESSRGCWWGQKNHCVFCGLNSEDLTFRARSVDRVVEDMLTLSTRYNEVRLFAADLIVAWPALSPVLERLAQEDIDLILFYEVRPKLKKSQIKLLADAGVTRVQPGIESLSTEVLQLMDKGTTQIVNIQFLKWAKEYSVNPAYNFLMGFPGEKSEWYDALLELVPKLYHLDPSDFLPHLIEIHRFSPIFEHKERFGIKKIEPRADYQACFPEGTADLAKVSYYFQEANKTPEERTDRDIPHFGSEERTNEQFPPYMQRFIDACKPWLSAHKTDSTHKPVLEYRLGNGFMRVKDFRQRPGRFLTLTEEYFSVMLLCDRVQKRAKVVKRLSKLYKHEDIEEAIEFLLKRNLLISEGNEILSLVVGAKPRSTQKLEALALGKANDDNHSSATAELKPEPPASKGLLTVVQ